ncbi:MAG: hypothetical protein M5U08_15030 [Burkholderiales bacterium]|nr:hypothetical protein [Burkholderiales bacterium]
MPVVMVADIAFGRLQSPHLHAAEKFPTNAGIVRRGRIRTARNIQWKVDVVPAAAAARLEEGRARAACVRRARNSLSAGGGGGDLSGGGDS